MEQREIWSVRYGGVYEAGYHVVWCPNYRKVLVGPISDRPSALLQELLAELGGSAVQLAIQPDHVRLSARMETPYGSPAQTVHRLKGSGSRASHQEYPELRCRLLCL
jgi:putative transposase